MEEDDNATLWREPAKPARPDVDDSATVWRDPAADRELDDTATLWSESLHGKQAVEDDNATVVQQVSEATPVSSTSQREMQARSADAHRVQGTSERLVLGRYQLLKELEPGSQALAYTARDIVSDSLVFVKKFHASANDEIVRQQIAIRDAVRSLRHRNLMRCLDVSLDQNRLYAVAEVIDGQPMDRWLREKRSFDDAEIQSIVAQLSAGIHELHTQGKLAHRDIKPANILVTAQGDPFLLKIVDYDVACNIESGGVTRTRGTPYYWPPEFSGRQVANSEAPSADWWGLGRIVQEMVDGVSLEERIRRLMQQQFSEAQRTSVQFIFDEIMAGRGRHRWGVRPGMIEEGAASPRTERWLPLLRGLLTEARADRWGYDEIRRFLGGENVKDFYAKSLNAEPFQFSGEPWPIRKLAVDFIEKSAQQGTDLFAGEGPGKKDPWNDARDLVRKGDFTRYAHKVLCDVDLARELERIGTVTDRDLGTALALARLAETGEPPLLKHAVINRNFAFHLAERNDTRAQQALEVLLTEPYRRVHGEVHTSSAAELNRLAADLAALRLRLQGLQIQSNEACTDRLLLQQMALAEAQRIEAIDALHAKLSHTTQTALQQLFAQPSAKLSSVDSISLLLSLRSAAKNGFVTYESKARNLQARARTLRTAAALKHCTSLYTWWSKVLQGSKWFRSVVVIMLIVALVAALRGGWARLGLIDGVVWLLLLCAIYFCHKQFVALLRKDLKPIDPDMAAFVPWNPQILQKRTKEWNTLSGLGTQSPNKELKVVNQQIAALPGINASEFIVWPVSLRRAHASLGAVATLLFLALAQSLLPAGTGPSVRMPWKLPLPSTSRPAPGIEPMTWRGQTIMCVINNANAISGNNGRPNSQTHRTLIYYRPIVIEGGTVHDLTLHSSQAVFLTGGARQMNINTARQLVIRGDIAGSTIVADDVEIDGNVRHSKIRAHNIRLTGTTDRDTTLTRVPEKIALPPPRQF